MDSDITNKRLRKRNSTNILMQNLEKNSDSLTEIKINEKFVIDNKSNND